MTEYIKSFEELWRVHEQHPHIADLSEIEKEFMKQVFFAGALGGVGVLTNRISDLPNQVDGSALIPAISRVLASTQVELEKINHQVRGMPVGSA